MMVRVKQSEGRRERQGGGWSEVRNRVRVVRLERGRVGQCGG